TMAQVSTFARRPTIGQKSASWIDIIFFLWGPCRNRPFFRQTGDPCHKPGLRVEQPIAKICVRLTPLPQVFRPSASFTGHAYLDCLSGTSGSCGMLTGAGVYNSAS